MKRLVALLLALALAFSLCSCVADIPKSDKIQIISSVFPSYDFARQLTKNVDNVEVSLLITPGTEPHSYDPGVPDMAKIKECDLFIYLGGESDLWAESLLDTFSQNEVNTLRMVDCVELLESQHAEGMQGESHSHAHSHHHESDEHVWTSPLNAIKISEKIKDKLVLIDPQNSDLYQENFDSYKLELLSLHQKYMDVLNENVTLIIADRFPFRYLAYEYGFNYFAAFSGCSTESDPSASTIAFLENKINENKSTCVFYTEFSSQKVADTLCEATDVKKLRLHSCHNVDKQELENGVTYISLMEENLKNIQEAL